MEFLVAFEVKVPTGVPEPEVEAAGGSGGFCRREVVRPGSSGTALENVRCAEREAHPRAVLRSQCVQNSTTF